MLNPIPIMECADGRTSLGNFAHITNARVDDGGLETKVRLGRAAGSGETLYSLGIHRWEPHFRGRWNAGSTKRSGGSTIDPVSLARHLAETLMKRCMISA
jgi:hypothetical protein